MARTLPTEPIEWAESGAIGDVVEPPIGVRDAGYQFEDILPHEEHNAILRGVYRWLQYLGGAGGAYSFDSLYDAEQSGLLVEGDSFLVRDNSQPLGLVTSIAGGGDVEDVSAWGGYVAAILSDGGVDLLNDEGTGLISDVTTAVGPWRKVFCTPHGLAVVDDDFVFLYAYADGATLWSYNHGNTISDVSFDDDYIYIAGVSGTSADGTGTHRALVAATGVEVWTQAWGATLFSICGTGLTVLIGGNVSGGFYGAEIARTTGVLIRNIIVPGVVYYHGLVSDGVFLYAMCTSVGLTRFAYSTGDYALAAPITATYGRLTIDDTFIYIREQPLLSNAKVYRKSDPSEELELRVQAGGTTINALASNGRRLFVAYDLVGGEVLDIFATTGKNKRFQLLNGNEFMPSGTTYNPETTVF